MKKYLLAIIGVAIIGVAWGLFSNTDRSNGFGSEDTSTSQDSVKRPENWKEEIQYAMTRHHRKGTAGTDIRLTDYAYKGTINTAKDISRIKEKLCGDDVFTVAYTSSAPMGFGIRTIGEIREYCSSKGIPMLLDSVAQQIDDTLRVGMDVIEVTWNFKGKESVSTAIAEKNGLTICEPIGQYLYEISDTDENNGAQSEERTGSEIKSTSWGSRKELRLQTQEFQLKGNVNAHTCYGRPVMSYAILCPSTFSADDGILREKNMSAHYRTLMGWNGSAECRSTGGTVNIDNYREFAWGYACLNGASLASFHPGVSLASCTGAEGAAGQRTHRIKY